MKGGYDSPSRAFIKLPQIIASRRKASFILRWEKMLKKQLLKALSRVGGNPSPVPMLQQDPSAGMDGQCWGSRKKSSSLLSACVAMKVAKQARAFQLLYKSISSLKPFSSAYATNPKAKYRA